MCRVQARSVKTVRVQKLARRDSLASAQRRSPALFVALAGRPSAGGQHPRCCAHAPVWSRKAHMHACALQNTAGRALIVPCCIDCCCDFVLDPKRRKTTLNIKNHLGECLPPPSPPASVLSCNQPQCRCEHRACSVWVCVAMSNVRAARFSGYLSPPVAPAPFSCCAEIVFGAGLRPLLRPTPDAPRRRGWGVRACMLQRSAHEPRRCVSPMAVAMSQLQQP